MSGVTLSSPTRSSLLSLQSTAELMARTQNNLATGRKVNSALDNPVNYFTAQSLGSRATDLSSLIDGISNGIQTIQAATKGIESIQKLVKLGQSMVDRAARAPVAVQTPAAVASMGSNYSSADIVGAQNATAPRTVAPNDPPANLSSNFGLSGVIQTTTLDFSTFPPPNQSTIKLDQGTVSKTYTYRPGGNNAGTDFYSTPNELGTKISTDLKISPAVFSMNKLSFTTIDDTQPITIASPSVPYSSGQPSVADTFSYTANGGPATTFTFHKPANPATDPGNRYFSDRASLVAAINAVTGPSALTAAIDPISNAVRLTAGDKDDTFSLSGTKLASLGYSTAPYEPSPSLDDTEITYTIGKGAEQKSVSVRYGYDKGETTTLKQLNDQLATADMFAVIDPNPNGKVIVKPIAGREADTIALSTPSTWVGTPTHTTPGVTLLTGATSFSAAATLSEPGASSRRQLAKDYTALLDQISGLARDSGYNGQNLLMGDNAKIQFNEKNTSNYEVKGSRVDAEGLGLETALDGDFLDIQSVEIAAQQLTGASNFLRSKASEFATGFSLTNVRQKFTNEMINVLQTGADNLTLADMNEEAANATALNLRQQLGISALSLSNQAQQGILQLLRT